jgi:hypothetical protein
MPSVVYIVALVAIPFFLAVGFALSDVTSGDPSFDFVGFRQLRGDLPRPGVLALAAQHVRVHGVSMVLIVVLGKVLANILIADFRGKWFVRFLVLLPWTTPATLSASPGCGCSTRSTRRSTGCSARSAFLDDLIVIFSDRQNPGRGENIVTGLGEPGLGDGLG